MKRFIKWLIIALLTFSSFGLIYYIYKLNVIKEKYLIIGGIVVILLWFFLVFKLIRKKTRKTPKILFGILSLILITIYSLLCRYANSTIDYAKKITNITYETVNYSVLALKNSDYTELLDLKNKKIGFLSSDKNLDKSIKTLNKKLDYTNEKYNEIGSLIGNLYENKVDSIVISDSYFPLLEDNKVEFVNDYKVIYKFSIKVNTKNDEIAKVDVTKDPFIVYISGTDSRTTVSDTARSDVNIIAVINPKINKVLLINTPRDYYVQLHGTYGIKDKLTHAGVYGIEMSKNTMQDLLDININYYAKVSFMTVVNLVDTIDGIDIYSEMDLTPSIGKSCNITEGMHHLDGRCALIFARERHSYASGDRHRGQNQQAVITAIINKLTNPKYLIRYNKILNNIDGTMETDISYDELTAFVKSELTNLNKWSVESISLDGTGAYAGTYSMGSDLELYVMIPDENTVNAAKDKINEYLNANE